MDGKTHPNRRPASYSPRTKARRWTSPSARGLPRSTTRFAMPIRRRVAPNIRPHSCAIRLRRSGSRFEESRLKWIEETVKNRQKNFYKEYQKLIPQTEKALVEKLIDNESGMQLSKLKEQLRSQESFRKYTIKQGKDPIIYDKKIETLKEKKSHLTRGAWIEILPGKNRKR